MRGFIIFCLVALASAAQSIMMSVGTCGGTSTAARGIPGSLYAAPVCGVNPVPYFPISSHIRYGAHMVVDPMVPTRTWDYVTYTYFPTTKTDSTEVVITITSRNGTVSHNELANIFTVWVDTHGTDAAYVMFTAYYQYAFQDIFFDTVNIILSTWDTPTCGSWNAAATHHELAPGSASFNFIGYGQGTTITPMPLWLNGARQSPPDGARLLGTSHLWFYADHIDYDYIGVYKCKTHWCVHDDATLIGKYREGHCYTSKTASGQVVASFKYQVGMTTNDADPGDPLDTQMCPCKNSGF